MLAIVSIFAIAIIGWAVLEFAVGAFQIVVGLALLVSATLSIPVSIDRPRKQKKLRVKGVVVGKTLQPEGSCDEHGIPYL